MAEPKLTVVPVGKLRTMMVYDFADVGDTLTMHSDEQNVAHTTIVASGAIEVVVPDFASQRMDSGKAKIFETGQMHALVALEPDTRIFNEAVI